MCEFNRQLAAPTSAVTERLSNLLRSPGGMGSLIGQVRALGHWGFLAAIAAACVVVPAAAAGAERPFGTSSPAAAAANETTYTDSSGEDPAAPDITTTVVSNNDAGIITVRINIPNRPQLTRDMLLIMFFDTDNNPATGDPETFGSDYAIELFLGEIALFRWDGTNFTRRPGDPASTSLIFAYQGGLTITISAAELGNTKGFGFLAEAIAGIVIDETTGDLDFANATADSAPAFQAGLYKYEVKLAPATLVVRKFSSTPARPAAGKTFALKLQAARSDTGALLQGGRVTCVGRIGSSPLRAVSGRFVGRQAVCTWRIPAGAKGKTFRGSIAIVFEGLRTARSYSRKIG